ncbi:MAG: hypothetical protein JNL08_05130 [Planctomycetes bacterium]|nr:hypothetical protein [Planctomycetota bacterium]
MVPHRTTPGNAEPAISVAGKDRARATAAPAVADALRALLAHDVADWDRHDLERFKERTVRSVFRGRLGGAEVHAKVFRADTLADRARDALRQGRGEREAAHLAAARALGLPVVEVLASGTAMDGGQPRSFVVTRTVPEAAPFTFAAPAAVQRTVGALLRTVHDHGIDLADLHPGNLVLDPAGRPFLLDLTSMRHGGPPSLRRRAAALALFCQDLDGGALDAAARELLAGYLAGGPPLADGLQHELALATHRVRARGLVAFGRRATRACRHTHAEARRRGQPRWFVHLGQGLPEAIVPDATRLLADPGPPLRRGRRGAVWLGTGYAIKERDAGAARSLWRAAYWLAYAGVPTAPPVALCLDRGRGFVFSQNLAQPSLAHELAAGALDAGAVADAARSLGTAVGRLHAHGLRNRDLKFDNLVRHPGRAQVCLVDLDGVRRASATDTRGRGADLGRLLAAFRGAGSPGGEATVRTFVRAYLRAHRRLLRQPPLRRILRHAERRAREWASAHR